MTATRHPVDLSIVIPAFREAHKIGGDIQAADKYLRDRQLPGEIIVVDDGSPDETARVAESAAREIRSLRVISYQPNRGKGYAIRSGMASTRGRVVMFVDAGLCVPYDDVDVGMARLAGGADIAIGSRRAPGARIVQAQPLHRQVGSRVFWLIVRTAFPATARVRDTQCGFKLFAGDVGRDLYRRCVIDRMMIDIEMICRAARLGYRIQEFPVHWTNDPDTRFKPLSGSLQNLRELWRIWWALNVARQASGDARA